MQTTNNQQAQVTATLHQSKANQKLELALSEFEKIRKQFAESASNSRMNALILGRFGKGKTFSTRTAPAPILIHSFDPGGSKGLIDDIRSGRVIVDSSFESESRTSPNAFANWEKTFRKMKADGTFEYIGTYVIDSITTFAESMLYHIVAKAGRPGTIPQLQDYLVQIEMLKAIIKEIAGLPCHFIALGHIIVDKDETTGKMETFPMVTGKLKEYLPLLFDEVYIAETVNTSKGLEYKFLTAPKGMYNARTRLGSNNRLEKEEIPDFKQILKKVGLPYEDKQFQ